MVIYLEKTMERLILCDLNIGLMKKWKSTMAKGGGNKNRYQYCTDSSGPVSYFRALQGHSGRNLIDPSQDKVLIPNDFLEYMVTHRMCNQFTLHLESRTDTRRTQIEKKTDGILYGCESYEQDPGEIDLAAPRLAWYKETAEKTSRHGVLGPHKTCSTERI